MIPDGIKPKLWAAERDLVAPEWRPYWDDMIWGSAFWVGGGHGFIDLTKRVGPATSADSDFVWENTPRGLGYRKTSNSQVAVKVPYDAFHDTPSNGLTIVWYGLIPTGADSGNASFFSKWGNGSNGWMFWTAGSGEYEFDVRVSGSTTAAQPAVNLVDGLLHVLVGTFDGADVKFYIDGRLRATTGGIGTISYSGSKEIWLGAYTAGDNETMHHTNLALVYSRAWTAAEVSAFQVEPFGFIRPDPSRAYNVAAGEAPPRRVILIG